MKGFLLELQRHPQASITCRTVVEDGVFLMQIGRKFFRTTPEETAQILSTPGFDAMPGPERVGVIMDVVKALSSLEEDHATATSGEMNAQMNTAPRSPRTKKEGSFLEIALTPHHYTYARKLRGITGYLFYDILTTVPLQKKDLPRLAQRPIILDASLHRGPVWNSIGCLPLETDRSLISYSWVAYPLPVSLEESKRGVRNPETEFFLVTEWFNPTDHVAYSKQTPAKREQLYGLQRWGVTTPAVVEEKLRLHYGLTPSGEPIPPVPLPQQPPW